MDIEEEYLEDILTQDNYSRKEPETYKECVLRAIEKCRLEMSKQMTKGKTIFIEKGGVSIPIVIPDQREVVISSVKTLYNLLLFTFDKEVIEKFKKLKESIKKLDEKYLKEYISLETYVPHRKYSENNKIINIETPLGNSLVQKKEDERMDFYEEMFQELVLLYKRKNELKNTRTAKT